MGPVFQFAAQVDNARDTLQAMDVVKAPPTRSPTEVAGA